MYRTIKKRLKEKCDTLAGIQHSYPATQHASGDIQKKIIKEAVLNLTPSDLPVSHLDLLNLGPKFVPSLKQVPVLDIVASTERAALMIERHESSNGSCVKAENLRHSVSNILLKCAKKKLPSNLSKPQEKTLYELKKNDNFKVVPFDKGIGFTVLDKTSMIEKIEEHLKDAKEVTKDPTDSLKRKFQREISALKKGKKIDKMMFYNMYPSDTTPPRLYGFVKAHKPDKHFPMRPVVSTVGTAFHGYSKFLLDLLQPTLNKNLTRVKHSSNFAEEARDWNISANEVQVSYDVVNLYPSVPISRSIDVIMGFVKDDYAEICQRTKLDSEDIEGLLRLCLSKCYFLWDNKVFVIEYAGPIGL